MTLPTVRTMTSAPLFRSRAACTRKAPSLGSSWNLRSKSMVGRSILGGIEAHFFGASPAGGRLADPAGLCEDGRLLG